MIGWITNLAPYVDVVMQGLLHPCQFFIGPEDPEPATLLAMPFVGRESGRLTYGLLTKESETGPFTDTFSLPAPWTNDAITLFRTLQILGQVEAVHGLNEIGQAYLLASGDTEDNPLTQVIPLSAYQALQTAMPDDLNALLLALFQGGFMIDRLPLEREWDAGRLSQEELPLYQTLGLRTVEERETEEAKLQPYLRHLEQFPAFIDLDFSQGKPPLFPPWQEIYRRELALLLKEEPDLQEEILVGTVLHLSLMLVLPGPLDTMRAPFSNRIEQFDLYSGMIMGYLRLIGLYLIEQYNLKESKLEPLGTAIHRTAVTREMPLPATSPPPEE